MQAFRPNGMRHRLRHRVVVVAMAATLVAATAQAISPPRVDPPIRTRDRAARDSALIIGNEAYASLPQASFAIADAMSVRDYFRRTHGISKYRIRYVEDASARRIQREIRRATRRVRTGGTLWVYFAGHGTTSSDGSERQLLGINAGVQEIFEGKGKSLVSLSGMETKLARSRRARRIVVMLDASFGGRDREGLPLIPGVRRDVPDRFATGDQRLVTWGAARADVAAPQFRLARHGLFTYLMLGALRGWADGELGDERDARVTLAEAQAFVAWTGRQLGYPIVPAREDRPELNGWVLSQGDQLEPRPTDDVLSALSIEARDQRFEMAETQLKAEVAAFWRDTLTMAKEGTPEGRDALAGFIDEYAQQSVTVEWAVIIPEVRTAQKMLQTYGSPAADALSAAEPPTDPCDELVPLQLPAARGQLSESRMECLENRVRTERLQTTREQVSLLLLAHTEATGDTVAWEQLMVRHLEEIDRSDPDLCMKFAIYLYRGDVEFAEDAIRWAEVSMENKQVWVGREHIKRVYGLHRLRSESAARLWRDAEQRYRTEPTDEHSGLTREYRGLTMDFAREWMDYANAANQPLGPALDLCMSAAGTRQYCIPR